VKAQGFSLRPYLTKKLGTHAARHGTGRPEGSCKEIPLKVKGSILGLEKQWFEGSGNR
jgi:hypothetical protein